MTDHAALKYYLHNVGKAEDQICRLRQKDLEMAEYIVCAKKRIKISDD